MAKSTATPTDPKRVSEIAGKIHSACSQIGDDTRAIAEHQAEVQELSARINGVGGTRLGIVTEIAAMSHAEQWTNSEVVAACGLAVKMGNSQDSTAKTIGVFISEMKTFASPKVREQFPTILEACQNAWAEEQEYLAGLEGDERKGADTPVRKFKSRIYHLVIEIARRVKADDIEVTTAEDVVEWARAHDPDLDADKVAGKLAKVIADIDAIYTDFGQSDLKVAADFLRQVTVEELMAARKALQGDAPDAAPGTPVAHAALISSSLRSRPRTSQTFARRKSSR